MNALEFFSKMRLENVAQLGVLGYNRTGVDMFVADVLE